MKKLILLILIFLQLNIPAYAILTVEERPQWRAQIFLANQIKGIGLVDSFLDEGLYPEMQPNMSWVYDNAVAAMGCILMGNYGLAAEILLTLCAEVKKYVADIPAEGYDFTDKEGNYLDGDYNYQPDAYCGNTAWLLQALNLYQKTYQDLTKSTSAIFQKNNKSLYDMQVKLANYLLTLQDTDGGLRGSKDVSWKSTEHNIIAYVALRNFGRLNGSPTYVASADKIITFIISPEIWNSSEGRFNRGENDPANAVDAQALGVLLAASLDSFYGTNNVSLYSSALTWAENKHKVNTPIIGFDFNDDKDTVWLEGTLQMALAFYKVNNTAKGNSYYNEALKIQQSDGSLLWATNDGTSGQGYNLRPCRAVVPAAWVIFCSRRFNPLILY